MKLTRRLFASRAPLAAAAAPMALPSALHQTAGSFMAPPTGRGYRLESVDDSPISQRTYDLFNQARKTREDASRRVNHANALLGGLDADLFALRSIPVTQKARIQAERTQAREEEHSTWIAALAKQFGIPW